MKKDIKNKKLPNKEQKKDELTDKELKGISGGYNITEDYILYDTDYYNKVNKQMEQRWKELYDSGKITESEYRSFYE